MKTAIVDKNPSVSSAALVSAYHLLPIAKDVVRRWQSETQEAAASSKSSGSFSLGFSSSSGAVPVNNSTMTQYHAIGLLYQMRMHDRMALVKMVQQFGSAGAVKSPAAVVMLVRLAAQLAEEDAQLRKPMTQLLDGWLRHKSEMVNFEAAKAICDLRDVSDEEVSQAVHVLQLFLTSPRAVTKFAALRILHNFASFKPQVVNVCNPDIELLISNSNRSIATFAITTLLKTGNEASVDRLMKQISGFMSEISDEFKITIVEAIRTLCLKFPSKQAGMLAFLSGILRDEGGYEFKRAVVESMFDLIKFVPDSKEDALAHLCEFIEDCEFTKLAVRILHLLGREGPKTSQPTKYIRYIYNRVVLENAIVRAAAVTALAKFGVGQKDPEVKRSVHVLLTRCLDDVDDEVRDRAALNLRLMSDADDVAEKFVKNGRPPCRVVGTAANGFAENMFSLPFFEHQLVMYVTSDDKGTFESPFDISKIPVVTREQADAEDRTKKLTATAPTLKAPKVGPAKAAPTGAEAAASATAQAQKYAQELMQIPEMKEFGGVLKSSPTVELTEAETEYVVSVVKHIFKEHIVLQYEVKNTLPATVLENVSVVASPSDEEELEEVFILQAEKLQTDEPGKVYVAFHKVGGDGSMPVSTFSNVLKFTSKEIDPTTNEPEQSGYDDEYEVAEFDLAGSDYVVPAFASNFSHLWEQVGAAGEEAEETLQLGGVKSIAGRSAPSPTCECEPCGTNGPARRDGAARQNAVAATTGRHRRASQPDYPHAQAVGKDGQRREGGCQCPDGLLVQVGGYHQNHSPKRGRGRRGPGGWFGSVMALAVCGGHGVFLLRGWAAKRIITKHVQRTNPGKGRQVGKSETWFSEEASPQTQSPRRDVVSRESARTKLLVKCHLPSSHGHLEGLKEQRPSEESSHPELGGGGGGGGGWRGRWRPGRGVGCWASEAKKDPPKG